MAAEEIGRIRNVGIVGQGGVGKTLLADALVLAAGATNRLGRVDDGSSLFDFEPEEVRRKTTIVSSLHHVNWKKHEITIADTPGLLGVPGGDPLRAGGDDRRGAGAVAARRGQGRARARLGVVRRAQASRWSAFMSQLDREETDLAAALAPVARALGTKVIPVDAADRQRAEPHGLRRSGHHEGLTRTRATSPRRRKARCRATSRRRPPSTAIACSRRSPRPTTRSSSTTSRAASSARRRCGADCARACSSASSCPSWSARRTRASV